jgi:galactokinase
VNLLGEHVDYNGGVVMPAAIDRTVQLVAAPLTANRVEITALDLNAQASFDLGNLESKTGLDGQPLPDWALYPAGVAWAALQQGLPVGGARVAFRSNVPIGAGLSSSAAVEVAFGALWREMAGWSLNNLALAQLCQQAENQYVGVNCGLMDQFACANGVEGHALYFDTRSLEWHPVPLPPHTALVIADSSMRRTLVTSAYNERREACSQAVQQLQVSLPHVSTLRDVSPRQFASLARDLPEPMRLRAQHVVDEIARVEEAARCLQVGDADCFGRLMLATHASLRDLFQVSIPELDLLVEIAAELPGCYGARLTGAGFGGCTVNLVAETEADAFMAELKREYQRRSGRAAEVYLCHASQGVTVHPL